jgi:hypothetical protein
LENPRIIFLWMNIHGTRMILIQKEKWINYTLYGWNESIDYISCMNFISS